MEPNEWPLDPMYAAGLVIRDLPSVVSNWRATGNLPDYLREKFPVEMTIVVQHQFWDLEIGDEAFSITLSFQKQLERLTVPFATIRTFADPSVNFALEFTSPAAPQAALTATALPAPALAAAVPPKAEEERQGAEVVALDAFRKR